MESGEGGVKPEEVEDAKRKLAARYNITLDMTRHMTPHMTRSDTSLDTF